MEDGRLRKEDRGWRMEDGRLRKEDRGWRMEDGVGPSGLIINPPSSVLDAQVSHRFPSFLAGRAPRGNDHFLP
jgi:hypothetical protein